mgnify:CR=1 FL=1
MSMNTNHGNDFNKNTTDRNMNDKSVTAFLLSPRYRIYRHLLLQLVVVLITINVLWYEPLQTVSFGRRLGGCLAYFASMNMVIYINLYVLVPYFLLKNRWGSYVLMAVITNIAVITFLSVTQGLLFEVILPGKDPNGFATFINAFSGILTIGFVMAGSAAISLFMHWLRYNLRIDELESTTLQSELKFLKNQINPHFLFNMLNNANILVKDAPDEASQILEKLDNLLRYQLNDSTRREVFLTADIQFLTSFLELEKVRRDHFEYTIFQEGNMENICIPPLLFIPFVENAVKHNLDSDNLSYVHLYFSVHNKQLTFRCENSKPRVPVKREGGIGLANVKRRLDLLYESRYTLQIEDKETTYNVNLHLNL